MGSVVTNTQRAGWAANALAAYLCSIFTAASLHHYDTEKEYREGSKAHQEALKDRQENKYGMGEICWSNYRDSVAWTRRLRILIDSIQQSPPYDHGYDNMPVTQLDKFGRSCRLRAAREQRRTRLAIEEICNRAIKDYSK